MKLHRLNMLQMPTWRWLRLNETELDLEADIGAAYKGEVTCRAPEGVLLVRQIGGDSIPGLPPDMEQMRQLIQAHYNYGLTITIPKGLHLTEPVCLNFQLDEDAPLLIDFLHIIAEEGSWGEVVITYHSSGKEACLHSGFAYLQAAPGANVRLTKAQLLGENDTHLDMNAIRVAEKAQGDALLCDLGGGQVVGGCNVSLAGRESRSGVDSLYLGSGAKTQDFSYRMELKGPESEGEVVARGVLTGGAKKVLKSTLDFVRGASGAKGRERETVLALSDRTVNLSVPLLLCGEENVEGEHAATSGRPDPQKLFYLMSRGLSKGAAKRLLVEASFAPVLNKIPDEALRHTILSRIQEVIQDGD